LAARVLEAVADAIVAIDRDNVIVCWTPTAERLFGVPARQALGQRLTTVFPLLVHNDPIEVATLGGAETLHAVRRLGRGGPPIAITVTPICDEPGEVAGTVAVIRPLSGWLDSVERTERPQRQWYRTLGAIARDLINDRRVMDDSKALSQLLVARADELIPGGECLLAVVHTGEPQRLRVLAGAGPWAERQVGAEWPMTGTLAGRSLQDGRALESPRLREAHDPIPGTGEVSMHSGRFVPLHSSRPLPDGSHTLGVLAFYCTTRTYFTPYERRLTAEFSRLVTLSLEQPEILYNATVTAARLGGSRELAVELAVALDPCGVDRALVRQMARAVDTTSAKDHSWRAEAPTERLLKPVRRSELVQPVALQSRQPLVVATETRRQREAESQPDKSPRRYIERGTAAGGLPERVLHALADAVIAMDRDGQVIMCNRATERLLGISAEDMLGQPLPEVGISVGKLEVGIERRITLHRPDGSELPSTITTTALAGQDAGMVLLVKEITPWIGPVVHGTTHLDTLIDNRRGGNPAYGDDGDGWLDSVAGHKVEIRMLTILARLLPARERERFVIEAMANVEFCDNLLERIHFLIATAVGMPRLAFMLRRAGRRRSRD
jgi:PAS domain-containing protein